MNEFINEVNNPCYLEELTVSATNECACCESLIFENDAFCFACVGDMYKEGDYINVQVIDFNTLLVVNKENDRDIEIVIGEMPSYRDFMNALINTENFCFSEFKEIYAAFEDGVELCDYYG